MTHSLGPDRRFSGPLLLVLNVLPAASHIYQALLRRIGYAC
jgi:hypothetical protein